MKTLYKKTLHPSECGMSIFTKKYVCIYETPCFYMCVQEWNLFGSRFNQIKSCSDEKERSALAKKLNIKLKRIHKVNSRFAFVSEKDAFDHLVLLKRKQINHLKRDIELIEAFVDYANCNDISKIPDKHGFAAIPDTQEVVMSHYVFD